MESQKKKNIVKTTGDRLEDGDTPWPFNVHAIRRSFRLCLYKDVY